MVAPWQETGDRNQQATRLAAQIAEAEEAYKAAKAERNEAQDRRKAAQQRSVELGGETKKAQDTYDKAFAVSTPHWEPPESHRTSMPHLACLFPLIEPRPCLACCRQYVCHGLTV